MESIAVGGVVPSSAMFTVVREEVGPWETYALTDAATGTRADVAPGRGGMVTRFVVGQREVLFMDRDTLQDPTRNVRGGIPVLFPIAGRLQGDAYTVGDRSYSLAQHGFARTSAWRVVSQRTDTAAEITLALGDNPATRTVYPFGFDLRVTYAVAKTSLSITTEVTAGARDLPVHLGFHPYFYVDDARKREATVRTDATHAWDNHTQAFTDFHALDLTLPEVDLHLLDHGLPGTTLSTGDGHRAVIEMDEAFKTLVVWTLAGRDFVCVEPWTAPAGALATGAGRVTVAAGTTWRVQWTIRV